MKQKFLLLLLATYSFVFSQQKSFDIEWSAPNSMSTGSFVIKIPSFNKENYAYDIENGIQFISHWEQKERVNESSVRISNVKYSRITKSELFDLNINTIPSELSYSIKNSKARDKQFVFFRLSPIIKDGLGSYKKIISFQINYTNASSSSQRFTFGKRARSSMPIS